ncbi:GNAT family N-acetyltransferase [Diplocloster hominis]|uniref:GNAT family N-acetyltransferase n=1 Tax=Diplocloster hominis TaxID=3079010 RepID=UPI0031BB2B40
MEYYETQIEGFRIRKAGRDDIPVVLELIKELAEYEKMSDDVVATPELLEEWIFDKEKAHVLLGEAEGEIVGMALYFYNFSTFLGRAGIYLEDLYVKPSMRGSGMGKALLTRLTRIAVEEGCGRMEWSCLNWNTPSIGFYKSLGAVPMDEWTVYRLTGDVLKGLGSDGKGISRR